MKKTFAIFLLILNSVFLLAKDDLEKAKQKLNKYKSISYTATAFYPNPEIEEISTFTSHQIINNFNSKDFNFYNKTDDSEEIYENGIFSKISNNDKTINQYEEKQNQINFINNSRLVQYGPSFLLKYHWKFEDEVIINKKKNSHYSFIENTFQYEGKTIKIKFHLYISQHSYTVSKFERRNYMDNKITQTIKYEYSNYKFSKKEIPFNSYLPKNYALIYFERSEITPLEKGTKAPHFIAKDIENKEISTKDFIGKKTLLLFSATNCGVSQEVSNLINNENYQLPKDLELINFYASDSKENVQKFFRNKSENFPIITDQKEIEKNYQISGYPVLYLIDERGIIVKTFDGLEPIIEYLKSVREK